MISVDQRHGTGIYKHLCLRLLNSWGSNRFSCDLYKKSALILNCSSYVHNLMQFLTVYFFIYRWKINHMMELRVMRLFLNWGAVMQCWARSRLILLILTSNSGNTSQVSFLAHFLQKHCVNIFAQYTCKGWQKLHFNVYFYEFMYTYIKNLAAAPTIRGQFHIFFFSMCP